MRKKIVDQAHPFPLYRSFTTIDLRRQQDAFLIDLKEMRKRVPEHHADIQFVLSRLNVIATILIERDEFD